MNIRQYVKHLFNMGIPLEEAVRLAQDMFPHSCAGRSYIMQIHRQFKKEIKACQQSKD